MHVLRNVSLFRYLNDHQLTIIGRLCTKKSFVAGEMLFYEKDRGSEFYVIISGSVKIFTASDDKQQEKILTVLKSGDSFGELSLIDQQPRSASAQVIEDAVLYGLRGELFMNLLKSNFDIAHGIMIELCNRLRETNQKVHDLTFLDERSRIIKSIIQMAAKNGQRDGHLIYFKLALNHDELAQMAGVNKEVMNQVMNDFQNRSILSSSEGHYILDLSKIG